MDELRALVEESHLTSANVLAERLDRNGSLVTAFVPRGYAVYVRILNPIEHRDGTVSSWSAAWAANHSPPSPWMQWDELAAIEDAKIPDVDGAPRMGAPHPALASALIAALAREHDLRALHRFAVWAGYGEEGRKPTLSFSPEDREMLLYSGRLVDGQGTPTIPITDAGRVPMYWWPDDLAWCVGHDIYARSLLVGCDVATAGAILAAPGLEAYRVRNDDQVLAEDF